MRYANLEQRLICNSVVDEDTGCWEFLGSRRSGRNKAYAKINVRRDGKHVTLYVHRLSYEVLIGPIPENHEIDHKCRNTICINPNHLEAVWPLVNIERRDAAA